MFEDTIVYDTELIDDTVSDSVEYDDFNNLKAAQRSGKLSFSINLNNHE